MLTIRADRGNSSSALSLMSTDTDRAAMSAFVIFDIIPSLIFVVIALWILGMQLGAAAVTSVTVCLLCTVAAGYNA